MVAIDYNPLLTGITAGQPVKSAHLTENFIAIQNSINTGNILINDFATFSQALETGNYIRNASPVSFSTATNSIIIAANAVTFWDDSLEQEITGWNPQTLSVTGISSGIIWAITGSKTYQALDINAARPANGFMVGFFTNTSGAVSIGINFSKPWEEESNYFQEIQYFLKELRVLKDLVFPGGYSYKEHIGSTIATFRATPPADCLVCNGAEISRTTYADLFNAIGTIGGTGNDSTTFNVPDLRNRTIVGSGLTYALGAIGGAATHTLTSSEMPFHQHGQMGHWYTPQFIGNNGSSSFYTAPSYVGNLTQGAGGGQPHNNMPPYRAALICIKYR